MRFLFERENEKFRETINVQMCVDSRRSFYVYVKIQDSRSGRILIVQKEEEKRISER